MAGYEFQSSQPSACSLLLEWGGSVRQQREETGKERMMLPTTAVCQPEDPRRSRPGTFHQRLSTLGLSWDPLKKNYFIYICVSVFSVCMNTFIWVPSEVKSPGTSGTSGCEQISVDAGNWTLVHILNNCRAIPPALGSLCNFKFCPKETFIQARNVSVQCVRCYLKCPDSSTGATHHQYSMVNCKTNAIIVLDEERGTDLMKHRPSTLQGFPKEAAIFLLTVFSHEFCSTSPGAHGGCFLAA